MLQLMQLGMVHPDRVNSEEIKDLWSEADHNGDGFVDYKEFQVNIVFTVNTGRATWFKKLNKQ